MASNRTPSSDKNGPPLLKNDDPTVELRMGNNNANNSNSSNKSSDRKGSKRLLLLFIAATIILFILSLILLTAFILTYNSRKDVCITSECIQTAASILDSMDDSVDPCEDFYEYACGNWMRSHPIPDDSASISNFENLGVQMENILKRLLLEKSDKDELTSVTKAKDLFKMCINDSEILSTWNSVFKQILEDLDGYPTFWFRWPALNPTWRQKGDYEFEKLYGRLAGDFGLSSLFKATVQPDDKNSSLYIIMLNQPELNLHVRDFYLNNQTVDEQNAYMELIQSILKMLNATQHDADNAAANIWEFEKLLANTTTPEDERNDIGKLYTNLSLKELRQRFPNFDWIMFFTEMFKHIPYAEESGNHAGKPRVWEGKMAEDIRVVVYGTTFWEGFNQLIRPGNQDKKTLIDYVMWCWFFKEMLRDLPDPFATTFFKFSKALQVRSVPRLRWHHCVTKINSLFKWVTAKLYVDADHFDPAAKKKVNMMIDMIMDSFHTILDEEEWLSPFTKKRAREKIEAISRKVGYPELVHNGGEIEEMYEEYQTYKGNYFKTKFQSIKMDQKTQLGRLGSPINRTHWASGAAVVNAFYSPNTNEIIIPMGILRPVFWSVKYPWSMNFGGIGVVIGHEVTHGFDDRGRLYDKEGNIIDWWDNQTIHEFEGKAKCIEEQYSKYQLKQMKQIGLNVSGKRTKGENIADNGGLKQAYMAYNRWVNENGEEPKLPGINLNHKQIFFLNYAQIWCGSMNDKEAMRKLKTAVHSPGEIRVQGPLSNSKEFSEAFSCKSGARMNPTEKCRVW